MHRLSKFAATSSDLTGEFSSLTANRYQFIESAGMCGAELPSCNSSIREDDPATAELLAMLGIDTGAPSAVTIDCGPVDLRI